LSEAFYILNEEKMVDEELTNKLLDMTGFRNIIAHDYGEIDYDIVYNVLHDKLADIEKFLEVVKQKIL